MTRSKTELIAIAKEKGFIIPPGMTVKQIESMISSTGRNTVPKDATDAKVSKAPRGKKRQLISELIDAPEEPIPEHTLPSNPKSSKKVPTPDSVPKVSVKSKKATPKKVVEKPIPEPAQEEPTPMEVEEVVPAPTKLKKTKKVVEEPVQLEPAPAKSQTKPKLSKKVVENPAEEVKSRVESWCKEIAEPVTVEPAAPVKKSTKSKKTKKVVEEQIPEPTPEEPTPMAPEEPTPMEVEPKVTESNPTKAKKPTKSKKTKKETIPKPAPEEPTPMEVEPKVVEPEVTTPAEPEISKKTVKKRTPKKGKTSAQEVVTKPNPVESTPLLSDQERGDIAWKIISELASSGERESVVRVAMSLAHISDEMKTQFVSTLPDTPKSILVSLKSGPKSMKSILSNLNEDQKPEATHVITTLVESGAVKESKTSKTYELARVEPVTNPVDGRKYFPTIVGDSGKTYSNWVMSSKWPNGTLIVGKYVTDPSTSQLVALDQEETIEAKAHGWVVIDLMGLISDVAKSSSFKRVMALPELKVDSINYTKDVLAEFGDGLGSD